MQRELTPALAIMVCFRIEGTHLTIRAHQPSVNGVRPLPGAPCPADTAGYHFPLGNITQTEATGNSTYSALWVTATQRLTHGLQFNAAYTLSKSLDYNSLNIQGVVVQNSYDLRGDRGLSDFDARHRFVVSAIYELPFRGNQFIEGWQLAAIVQTQTGNPVNIVTSTSTVNGVGNTLRPNVAGPISVIGNVDSWFNTSIFTPVPGFGSPGAMC